MPKNVLITPANGTIDFSNADSNQSARFTVDNVGNFTITNTGGNLTLGDSSALVYIGDGQNSTDVVFEQNGAIRALTGKTLTLGQSNSAIAVAAPVTSAQNITISKSLPKLILDSPASGDNWTDQGAQISLGESGDGGSAALHMTYVGNGYGYIGMGTIPSTGIPPFSAIRFLYNANQIYINSPVGIGRAPASAYTLDIGGAANVASNVTVGAGSAAAPSLTTFGDNNTGLFFPAADTIAFTEGGVETMRITSAGNIGVKTISPLFNLHVSGSLFANTFQEKITTATLTASTYTGNLIDSNVFDLTARFSSTAITFTNAPVSGNSFGVTLIIRQPGTAANVVTFANTVYWSNGEVPTLSSGIANKADIISLITVNGGSTFFGAHAMANVG